MTKINRQSHDRGELAQLADDGPEYGAEDHRDQPDCRMTFCTRTGPEHEVHRRSRIRQSSEHRQNQKDTTLADILSLI